MYIYIYILGCGTRALRVSFGACVEVQDIRSLGSDGVVWDPKPEPVSDFRFLRFAVSVFRVYLTSSIKGLLRGYAGIRAHPSRDEGRGPDALRCALVHSWEARAPAKTTAAARVMRP